MWRGEGKVLALQNTAGKGVVCDTSLNEKIFPLIVGHVFTGSPHLKGGGTTFVIFKQISQIFPSGIKEGGGGEKWRGGRERRLNDK